MCGIVGGVAERNIVPILLEGLRRLEYRGYDSSGIALLDSDGQIQRLRSIGKIKNLDEKIQNHPESFSGNIGIAHTRWATHGVPSENNAHPHICNNRVAVVHNGIIENYAELKVQQLAQGYRFTSETDTEVVAHAIHKALSEIQDIEVDEPVASSKPVLNERRSSPRDEQNRLVRAVQLAVKQFKGAYALGVVAIDDPDTLVVARKGSPLVIGIGIGEHFIASDVSALLPVTQNFIFLEEGDVAKIQRNHLEIYNQAGEFVEREVKKSNLSASAVELGEHRHYMHKEIFEQPQAVIDTLEGRITQEQVLISAFGFQAEALFKTIQQVQIIACGTSYHSGLVAKYWFEDIIGLSCQVEVASEYRYRNPVVMDNTLFVTISQSGETADTLAALQQIKQLKAPNPSSSGLTRGPQDASADLNVSNPSSSDLVGNPSTSGATPTPSSTESTSLPSSSGSTRGSQNANIGLNIPTLTICNVAESSLTRESDLTFLTHAGPEIGVASTKAFTTQLVALALLLTSVGKAKGLLSEKRETTIVKGLQKLPGLVKSALAHEDQIREIAKTFADKNNALFLGRGTMYPIAMEGALKLKEISYIHAEAYPAGELKHGPLALIDEYMPVIAIAPHDDLLEKLKSNLQEVNARGGQMIVFEDEKSNVSSEPGFKVVKTTTNVGRITAPITFNIALQLLSYHVALIKGTDVDQPRNLAKSVTVE
jgi:glucosamine--fructose-6-phosphate aminotransferase (isomerizing)